MTDDLVKRITGGAAIDRAISYLRARAAQHMIPGNSFVQREPYPLLMEIVTEVERIRDSALTTERDAWNSAIEAAAGRVRQYFSGDDRCANTIRALKKTETQP